MTSWDQSAARRWGNRTGHRTLRTPEARRALAKAIAIHGAAVGDSAADRTTPASGGVEDAFRDRRRQDVAAGASRDGFTAIPEGVIDAAAPGTPPPRCPKPKPKPT